MNFFFFLVWRIHALFGFTNCFCFIFLLPRSVPFAYPIYFFYLDLLDNSIATQTILFWDTMTTKVAMTRSKRHLCIVGDSDTLSKKDTFLKAWMDFLAEQAEVRYLE